MLSTPAASPSTLSLARFVEGVREFEPVDGCIHHAWLPDGRTTLVFRMLGDGGSGDVCVAGPRTRAVFKRPSGVRRAVALRFKPGWSAPLLGVSASSLTDRIVPLDSLWGRAGSELCGELLETHGLPDLLERLSRAFTLRTRQGFEPASARLARRAVRLLEDGEARVERVAEQLGVTARHLRRAFTENVGIGPKEFARTVRLQRAMRMAASSKDWGGIAADAGYYDQAHLIADFRQLIGSTPGDFLRRAGEGSPRFAAGDAEAPRECR
jgi:AraC-like DNA-binding protein